jgi:hypothetical protein
MASRGDIDKAKTMHAKAAMLSRGRCRNAEAVRCANSALALSFLFMGQELRIKTR